MSRLPLGRPLRYRDYPFVQPVRGTREAIPRLRDAVVVRDSAPLCDDLDAFASDGFDPTVLHPHVRRFFEERHPSMRVEWLRWERWALPLSTLYVPVAAALGNLCVRDRLDAPTAMSSTVRVLRWADGTTSREWIRTFSGTSQLFYVAAMRFVVHEGASYVSMAFPFGAMQLMVLLRATYRGDAMMLSTRSDDGLAGTYTILPGEQRFAALPGPPTDEVLVNAPTHDGVSVLHEDFLGRRRTFAMRYRIPFQPGSQPILRSGNRPETERVRP